MIRKYTFPRGGFIYEDATAPKKQEAVNSFLPAISVVPLGDSNGRVYPLVSPGDLVREGMLIGKASGPGTVNVHATIPGRVVRKVSWRNREGIEKDAIVISMEGSFEKLGKRDEEHPWTGLSGYDLQRIISDFGITEMEDSGKPLADMIAARRKEQEKLTIVIRCVFDDPWMVADYALCMDRIKEVIEGASIVAKACFKQSRIILAVSHHERKLGEIFLNEAKKMEVSSGFVITGSRYPQRKKRQLEIALRQYEKKEGLHLGSFLILGPAVFAAVHDAVKYKKPVLSRYIAVGGSAVRDPKILKVRIGTRISELIEQCGGFVENPYRIVSGSVLSGREVMYLDEPVDKTSFAIIAMLKSQASHHGVQNCINCGVCRTVCPVGLDPQIIYKKIKNLGDNKVKIKECHGCGCCNIICPSGIPLFETTMKKNLEAVDA